MKTSFMRAWRAPAAGLLGLGSLAVHAAPDTLGLGSGRNGVLPVGACTGTGCFAEGDLVLVYQVTGLSPVPASADAGPFDLGTRPVGRWEFARLAEVTHEERGA